MCALPGHEWADSPHGMHVGSRTKQRYWQTSNLHQIDIMHIITKSSNLLNSSTDTISDTEMAPKGLSLITLQKYWLYPYIRTIQNYWKHRNTNIFKEKTTRL